MWGGGGGPTGSIFGRQQGDLEGHSEGFADCVREGPVEAEKREKSWFFGDSIDAKTW